LLQLAITRKGIFWFASEASLWNGAVLLESLQAEIERLRVENENLKQKRNTSVSLKVSEKRGVSVYGSGRFPVTLCQEQWVKLLAMAEENQESLKRMSHA
jgi:hypothetical protein